MNKSLQFSSSLHESVREEISKRISQGIYVPGEPIPSTAMLSGEFGVSAITIKRALRDLQAAGMIFAVPGKGTYVKKQRRLLHHLDLRAPGRASQSKVRPMSVTREKISDPTMSAIDAPDKVMLCVRKIVLFEDAPWMYDATYVSSELDDEIVEEFRERFVVDALKRHDINVTNTRLVIDAAPASGQVAEVFGVPNGFPMLRRLYRMITTEPHITVYGVVQAPFDQLACTIDLAP
ncbi:GntR family transcriptional regulator [Paraburkholderia sp. MM5477-R1]|uniref:GntR family transcriptional regulator n=1 Tax=Paraburkholderia sp. MM5477-R1 TaxID=2991062 RepID=UPI003D20A785